jgi:hypothetical protein
MVYGLLDMDFVPVDAVTVGEVVEESLIGLGSILALAS